MPKSEKRRFIVQYPAEVSFCAGCSTCEIVCGLVHEGQAGPAVRRIFLERDTISLEHRLHSCKHCDDHPCYDACPRKNEAMFLDQEKGIVYIDSEGCIGCRLCLDACPFEPKRINFDKSRQKAVKCDLCRTRQNGPACVEYCQVRCIGISSDPLPPPPDAK
jgi:Fe-S-cluster-containing hydrogenase component 2